MKMLVIAAAIAAISGSASAADLVQGVDLGVPGVSAQYVPQNYVGVHGGRLFGQNNQENGTAGVRVGRDVHPNVRVEAGYEHQFRRRSNDISVNRLDANVQVGKRFGAVTPYALVGAGYEFRDSDTLRVRDRAVYEVGAGARVDVTDRVEIDTRYRYVDGFSRNRGDDRGQHVITSGVNFKF